MPELTITVAWPSADAPGVRVAGAVDASAAGRVQMAILAVASMLVCFALSILVLSELMRRRSEIYARKTTKT